MLTKPLNSSLIRVLFSSLMLVLAFSYDGQQWEKLLGRDILQVTGTGSDNIVAFGIVGQAFHYNGSDWQQLVLHPDFNGVFAEAWTNGKELFVTGSPPDIMGTIVFHGE